MRLVFGFVLAACVSLLPLALGGGDASAGIVCGKFDGKFTCRSDSSAGSSLARTPARAPRSRQRFDPDAPSGGRKRRRPRGRGLEYRTRHSGRNPDATGCQHGMVGTPPNCQCPKNSELLGGNCVHYTASACSSGLASDALPQACRGVEEKVSCTMRQDGLKDCCCVIYDKF